MKVSIDNVADAITDILDEYSGNIELAMKDTIKKEGKEAVKELRATSPHRTGKYAKGWTSKVTLDSSAKTEVVVHNKTEYRLAHLLENGHAMVTKGGRTVGFVQGQPHIKKVEEKATAELEAKITEIIRRGQ